MAAGEEEEDSLCGLFEACCLKQSTFLDDFELDMNRPLGFGGQSGGVYMCKRRRDNQPFAVKFLIDSDMSRAEIDMHRQCAAAAPLHVVCVEAFYDSPDVTIKTVRYKYALVLEFMPHGDLFSFLEKNRGPLNEHVTSQIMTSASRGIAAIHALGISHRDLKLENFMMEIHEDAHYSVKLTDFGLSTRKIRSKSPIGTPYYAAPEVVLTMDLIKRDKRLSESPEYDQRCDIWGLGVCMFMLLSNVAPFRGDIPGQAYTKRTFKDIVDGRWEFQPALYWKQVSEKSKNIIRRLLVVNPDQRLTVNELISELEDVQADKTHRN